MGKFLTICGIIGAVVLCYLVLLPSWPIITSTAFGAANTINATANAYNYRATTAGLRFAPLVLFFIPAIIGTVAVYIIFKRPDQNEQ